MMLDSITYNDETFVEDPIRNYSRDPVFQA